MKFGKATAAALRPTYWRALARGVVPAIEHGPAFTGIEPATIIDVGANKGQFASFAAARWPAARIVAFEPLAGAAAKFRRVLGKRARLFDCALGETTATLDIHVASRADSSSLLPLGDLQKRVFSMGEIATRSVPVKRLDDVLQDENLREPMLLKIDVQGYEYQVLRGIGKLELSIRWLYVEVSFDELYTNQVLFPEIETLADELGFECVRFLNEVQHDGRRIQADALFARKSVD